jgi:hypothetical protein
MTTTIRRDVTGFTEWTTGAFTLVVDPIDMTTGRTLADWDTFELTVWEDPRWPRGGADAAKKTLANLDPVSGGWSEVTGSPFAGTVVTTTLEFDVPAGTVSAGVDRYVAAARGIGGDAGDSPLVVASWVSVYAG